MFTYLTEEEIHSLNRQDLVDEVSRWDTLEKAASFYASLTGVYTGYTEDPRRLTHAFATPVIVFKFKENANER